MKRTGIGRALLGVAVTTAAVVPVIGAPTAPPVSAGGACGPLGLLVEYTLNDRCDFGSGIDPMRVDAATVVDALRGAGLFATTLTCRDGSVVPVAAAPNRLLITAANANRLAVGARVVAERLGDRVVGDPQSINALATVLPLRAGSISPRFLRKVVPRLQGEGWSADLDYFEPALPNNGFRPGGNPAPGAQPRSGAGGRGTVLVVDSPAQPDAHPVAPDVVLGTFGELSTVYDVDGNELTDEDHGHGVFVASLVQRMAPDARVVLAGVHGGRIPRLARWSPMLFSDADVIASLGDAFGLSPGGTAVRRSYDVVNLSLGGAGCDGFAARLPLGRFLRDLAALGAQLQVRPRYVAAAGNDGGNVLHYPAAWRDRPSIARAATRVDNALGGGPTPEGDEIRQIQAILEKGMIAAGSWRGGVRSAFSNCGDWVNGIAIGAKVQSRYPSDTTWARWSGTSFATARISARLVGGTKGLGDVAVGHALGAC